MESLAICIDSLNLTKINAIKIGFNKNNKNFELLKIKADLKVFD